MAFQSLGAARYPKYAECTAGDVLVTGHYVRADPSKFGGFTHYFEDESGQSVGLNGSGHLNYFIKQINVGDFVRITYLGQEEVKTAKFGLKMVHKFQMDKDSTRTRAVNPVTTEVANTPTAPTEDDLEF